MRKQFFLLLLPFLLAGTAQAQDVTSEACIVASTGVPRPAELVDDVSGTAQQLRDGASITLSAGEGISGLYLVFDLPYGSVTVTGEERTAQVDTDGMLHFFLDVEQALGQLPRSVTLTFSSGEAALCALRVFSPGALPDWVQRWERIPQGRAELLLLSTHGDDEQLFFAGLLPWYAAEKGYRVQVVYFTDHRNMVPYRVHEMLNGLWGVGVRYYPVFGAFPDYYTFDREDAWSFYEDAGFPRQALLRFVVDNLRYYRPLVAVGHDERGEYGHGMHQLTAQLLKQATVAAADSEQFPESAAQYGKYQVPKVYLHLLEDNPIVMDWDIPMESFEGLTAYQVTRDLGFAAHESQQADFAWYFRGADQAADIERFSPCRFGLFFSTVGLDTGKGDFFENLEPFLHPQEPETLPPTQLPVQLSQSRELQQAQRVAAPRAPASQPASGEKNWPAIVAAGTLALLLMTAAFAAPHHKKED